MYESHRKKYVLLFALYTKVASPLASEQLLTRLRDENENPMVRFPEDQQSWQHRLPLTQVRHECAEALGDIPGVEIEAEMAKYLDPKVDPVVRESCVVCVVISNHTLSYKPTPVLSQIALDMADYNNSKEFQYANGLSSINIPA